MGPEWGTVSRVGLRQEKSKFSPFLAQGLPQGDFNTNRKASHDALWRTGTLLASTYPHLTELQLSRSELAGIKRNGVSDPDALLGHVLRPDDNGLYRLLPRFDIEYEPELKAANVSEDSLQLLKRIVEQKAANLFSISSSKLHPRLAELRRYWSDFCAAMSLTSVGITIGHSNLKRRGLRGYELTTWIN
jgi:hypothetical protein